jgi:hypothetical protein
MEMLWPGPMVMIHYAGATAAAPQTAPSFAWGEPRRDGEGLLLPLGIEAADGAVFRLELAGDAPDLLDGVVAGDAKSGAVTWTLAGGALAATVRHDGLAGASLGIRVTPDPSRAGTVTGRVVMADGTVHALAPAAVPAVPARFELRPNHPNPFNPQTRISFALPVAARVDLAVYDLLGRRVRTLVAGEFPFGIHHADWDGRDDAGRGVASGTYLYRMQAGAFGATGKMLLVR